MPPPILSEESRRIVKGCVIALWKNSRDNSGLTADQINQSAGPLRVISSGDTRAVLGEAGLKAAEDLSKTVLSNSTIKIKFSKAEIERLTDEALLQVLTSQPSEIGVAATNATQALEERLAEDPVEWTIFYPIANLNVLVPEAKMGNVSFYPASRISVAIEAFRTVLGRQDATSEESIETSLKGFAIAQTKVSAVDRVQAELLAERAVSDALSALRLIASNRYRGNGLYTDFKGRVWTGTFEIVELSTKSVGLSHSRIGYTQPLAITERLQALLIFRQLSELLSKSPERRSEWERRIVSGIRIVGTSLNQTQEGDVLVGMISGLEALCLEEYSPRKEFLAERVAHMVGSPGKNKRDVYRKMKELYTMRSNIVHGQEQEVSPSDLLQITIITYVCFAKALDTSPTLPNDGDLFRWFDDQKFPSAANP